MVPNLNPTRLGIVNNVLILVRQERARLHGFEVSVNARLSRGFVFAASRRSGPRNSCDGPVTTPRTRRPSNPNNYRFCNQVPRSRRCTKRAAPTRFRTT